MGRGGAGAGGAGTRGRLPPPGPGPGPGPSGAGETREAARGAGSAAGRRERDGRPGDGGGRGGGAGAARAPAPSRPGARARGGPCSSLPPAAPRLCRLQPSPSERPRVPPARTARPRRGAGRSLGLTPPGVPLTRAFECPALCGASQEPCGNRLLRNSRDDPRHQPRGDRRRPEHQALVHCPQQIRWATASAEESLAVLAISVTCLLTTKLSLPSPLSRSSRLGTGVTNKQH